VFTILGGGTEPSKLKSGAGVGAGLDVAAGADLVGAVVVVVVVAAILGRVAPDEVALCEPAHAPRVRMPATRMLDPPDFPTPAR